MSAHEWGTENRSMRGNHQIAWDATSLGLFKTCPRKYYLTQIEGWVKKRTPTPLWFGIEFHHAVELAARLEVQGTPHVEMLREVVREIHFRNGYREWRSLDASEWIPESEMNEETVESLCLLRDDPEDDGGATSRWTPFDPDDSKRNLWTLIRSVVWYLDKFADDPAETVMLNNGEPAVELSFSIELPVRLSTTGEAYLLCGHMDKLVRFAGKKWVMDYKTSGNGLGDFFWSNFLPNNQMSIYTLAGKIAHEDEIAGVMITGIELAVGFNRFQRGMSPRTPSQNEEFYEDLQYWIKQAELCADLEHWPMNDESCGKYGGCVFRGVCSKSPEVREKFLKSEFKRQTWDPLRAR